MRRYVIGLSALALALGSTGLLQARSRRDKKMPMAGVWHCVALGMPNGDVPFTLHLHQSGKTVTGWVSSSLGDADITTASFKNKKLEIHIDTDQANYMIIGKLSHGKLAGRWSDNQNEKGTWKGHRVAATPQSQ